MKGIFVAGTDTGVGKTIVTGCLARFLLGKGYSVITQKWIQAGCGNTDLSPDDITLHLKVMRRNKNHIARYKRFILPYKLKTPCSPHLAAKLENKKISSKKIRQSFKFLSKKFDCVIVEGSGGVLAPFNRRQFIIDIAGELDLAVLVVAQNKLGAINHTLLTIEALRSRKINLAGIVFNNAKGEDKKILADNPCIVRSLSGETILGVLPWIEESDKLYEKFDPIGVRILKLFDSGTTKVAV